ncbi:hypothetical protein KKF64_00935 [Patescibacteria group bacterium]|nr:hypothetical protein [Patescibacteria group bacterium]
MYAYFIDDWVYNKHHRKLDRLDLLLTQKGISGRKIKLARLNDLAGSIRDCAASGIKTFVAVGNDTTASRLLNSILSIRDKEKEDFSFIFSVIPIYESNMIAKVFGYQTIQEASEALARHRTEKIDLGLLNSRHYFITSAIFPKKCSFGFKSYTVSSLYRDHHISVCNNNIYNGAENLNTRKFSITDGVLEAVIAHRPPVSFFDKVRGKANQNKYTPESIFPIKAIVIKSKEKTVSVNADAEKQLTTPIKVETKPKFLEVVIGNNFYGHLQD